jgi:L-threonylcarbamoyladenylate synthase
MITRIGKDIGYAASLLRNGELVAIPTETVYGLAGNALDNEAVLGIYEAKQRPRFNPLILHLQDFSVVDEYVTEIPEDANILSKQFSPGPISFLLPKSAIVPDLVTAGSDKVVIRIPSHPMALELLRMLTFPLAAPSANPFGYISPVSAQHVLEGLGGKIPYILDGGTCTVGLESTIVGFENNEIIIHRLGGITVEDIRRITGKDPLLSLLHKQPETPGQLKSHYAPSKKLLSGDVHELMKQNTGKKIAVVSFRNKYPEVEDNYILSPSGNLHEAASNLFSALRDLDKKEVELILAEKFPDVGIGRAINDRLSRASG